MLIILALYFEIMIHLNIKSWVVLVLNFKYRDCMFKSRVISKRISIYKTDVEKLSLVYPLKNDDKKIV